MSKEDLRLQIPLWNIAIWLILLLWLPGIIYCVDILYNNFEGVFELVGDKMVIHWNIPSLLSIVLGIVLLLVLFIAYFSKLKVHNRQNPNNKMKPFTFFKLGEFIEDDEMLRAVSQKATKKVYVLYTQLLQFNVLLMLFPMNRYIFIFAIALAIIIQNAIYYNEMRKYLTETENYTS